MQFILYLAIGTLLLPICAPSPVDECRDILSATVISEIHSFQPQIERIAAHVFGKEKGLSWKQTSEFVDHFGPRLAGSPYLEAAIDERRDFLTNLLGNDETVWVEPVELPEWRRGDTDVTLLNAWSGNRNKTLSVTTFGGSVGTGPDGIVAEAVVVKSFEELDSLKESEIRGKIIVFNYDWTNYFDKVVYRRQGSSKAAAKGAIAVLIRSLTGYSLYTPHTGVVDYTKDEPKIPSLGITVEDAELLWRKQNRGERLRLYIRSTAQPGEMVTSRNLIADIKGRGKPDELVVIGAHIDSWDVGQGAMDDGGGLAICWRTLEIMKTLNLTAERTVRLIFFTGEENGYYGANAYYANHKEDRELTQFILESDLGIYEVLGLATSVKNKKTRCILSETMKLFALINATVLDLGNFVGPDISKWSKDGVPAGSLVTRNSEYFHMHHSEADMMNVLNPEDLDKATIFWTGLTYVLANLRDRLPHDFH